MTPIQGHMARKVNAAFPFCALASGTGENPEVERALSYGSAGFQPAPERARGPHSQEERNPLLPNPLLGRGGGEGLLPYSQSRFLPPSRLVGMVSRHEC